MRIKKLLAAVATSALVSAPAIAKPAASAVEGPAASLSLSNATSVRAKTSVSKANKMNGELVVVGGLALAAAVGAIIAGSGDDSDSN